MSSGQLNSNAQSENTHNVVARTHNTHDTHLKAVIEGDRILDRVVGYVIENFSENVTLASMSEHVRMSRFSLCRAFQRRFGISPMRWLWIFRTVVAHEFIRLEPRWSLTDVAFYCGFTSSAHFSRFFKKVYGYTASDLRRRSMSGIPASSATAPTMPETKRELPSNRLGFEALLSRGTGFWRESAATAIALVAIGEAT